MNQVLFLFATSAAIAGILAAIAIWSPRRLVVKAGAVITAAVFLPITYVSYADLLSRPKPIDLEWQHRDMSEATVLASSLREGESIFLWLQLTEAAEPRAYVLPWNRDMAKQLRGAQLQANEQGTAVRMRRANLVSQDKSEPLFYVLPQQAPPPKPNPLERPIIFQRPTSS